MDLLDADHKAVKKMFIAYHGSGRRRRAASRQGSTCATDLQSVDRARADRGGVLLSCGARGHGPEAYENFDQRKKGWTKVVLKPTK